MDPTTPIESLPGGGLKCTDDECAGPLNLMCSKEIMNLAQPEKYTNYVAVKVRVIAKSELRSGLRHAMFPWTMFDMHVVNLAGAEVEVYVAVFQNAKKHYDMIQVGKAYYFLPISAGMYRQQQHSKLESPFSLRFCRSSMIIPVKEEPESLRYLALRAVGSLVSKVPKKEVMLPILARIPQDTIESLLNGHFLTFEAMTTLTATKEYNSDILSLTLSCYVMTRETCLVHASEHHHYPNLYQDLHCVFSDLSPFQFTTMDSNEMSIPKLLETSKSNSQEFPIVNTLVTFKRRFALFTRNLLDGLNWKNLFCAGGTVLAAITPLPFGLGCDCKTDVQLDMAIRDYYESPHCPFWNSDVDIFLYGLRKEEYQNKLDEVVTIITGNIYKTHLVQTDMRSGENQVFLMRTANTVSIVSQYPFRIIQLVLIPSCSPAFVLARFDIDCVCVGFDGEQVWMSQRGIRAVTKRYNLIDPDRMHKAYAYRLYKYSLRGYCVGIPDGYEDIKEHIRMVSRRNSYDTSTLFGKLLSLDNEITSLDPDLKPEASAYSACVPWGPSVSIADSYDHLAETPNLLLAETFEILTQIQEEHGKTWTTTPEPTFGTVKAREKWFDGTILATEDSPYYTRITGPLVPLLPPHFNKIIK